MFYQEFQPPPCLAAHIRCLWVLETGETASPPERIIPDGHPEIVIHYGRRPGARVDASGNWSLQPRTLFIGQQIAATQLKLPPFSGMIGVRFTPAGASGFLREDMKKTTGSIWNLSDWNAQKIMDLEHAIREARNVPERVALMTSFLRETIDHCTANPRLHLALQAMKDWSLGKPQDLHKSLDWVGGRQLERLFASHVGLSPNKFISIWRMQKAVGIMRQRPHHNLAEIALDCGFYDQPHFNRDFKRYTGITPNQFRAEENLMNGMFSDEP